MVYNWQQADWPHFQYALAPLEGLLWQWTEGQGRLTGLLQGLPEEIRQQSLIDIMVSEAVKTSAIEGEYLSRVEVLSSIRNRLGLNRFPETIKDKRAEGVARLMVAVRESFAAPLSESMLFAWHHMLMKPYTHINAGQWRSGAEPMQIISGAAGREAIHFEAPPSGQVSAEMKRFIDWFNQTAPQQASKLLHAPVRAAIAHLYFESIHPFEDGNGRIGRAVSEKALCQGWGRPILLSLSQAIEARRQDYYDAFKTAQRSNEITPWIRYFLQTLLEAQQIAIQQISFSLAKIRFFDTYAEHLTPRQEKVLHRMWEAGLAGFEGGMSAKKYMAIAKTSKATATRDLQALVEMGALVPSGEGRGRCYALRG